MPEFHRGWLVGVHRPDCPLRCARRRAGVTLCVQQAYEPSETAICIACVLVLCCDHDQPAAAQLPGHLKATPRGVQLLHAAAAWRPGQRMRRRKLAVAEQSRR